MELALHNLKLAQGSKKKKKRVGRGDASGRGSYSGRGLKGQKARSGGKRGLSRRGLKSLLRNKPKIGGFKSLKPKMVIVNINQLERNFAATEIVNIKNLLAKNLIKTSKAGVKVLGEGRLTKNLTVVVDAFSESAKKAIIEAGGTAILRSRK